MATITLKGNTIHTTGELPKVGSKAPDAKLVKNDLSELTLSSLNTKKVLNIFPSLDTGICAASVRAFNQKAAGLEGVTVVNISADLPFAHKRFCTSEGIDNATNASTFRSTFAKDYGLEIADGPMAGLCARVVLVLDAENTVKYVELVPEIVQEPNYDAALAAL